MQEWTVPETMVCSSLISRQSMRSPVAGTYRPIKDFGTWEMLCRRWQCDDGIGWLNLSFFLDLTLEILTSRV